ncbi:MAG: hypothetical protein ACYTAF_11410, partial [Planctomycetota bacterium]
MTPIPDDIRSGILWIRGGPEVAESVFRENRFGYWTAAFDTLLEKHGYVDFDEAPPSALADPEMLGKYDFLIVSWLPRDAWKEEYVRSLRAYGGAVFLEGPFPDSLCGHLGLKPVESPPGLRKARLEFRDESLRNRIMGRYRRAVGEEVTGVGVEPKRTVTRPMEMARSELVPCEGQELSETLHNICLSYLLAYRARRQKGDRYFDDPAYDALARLGWVRFLAKCEPGPRRNEFLQFLKNDLDGAAPPEPDAGDPRTLIANAIWGVLLCEAAPLTDG